MPKKEQERGSERDSLLQGEHLLLLVLVVVHLGTVGQLLVPRLENTEGQRGHEKVTGIHPHLDIHFAACVCTAHVEAETAERTGVFVLLVC